MNKPPLLRQMASLCDPHLNSCSHHAKGGSEGNEPGVEYRYIEKAPSRMERRFACFNLLDLTLLL